MMSSRAKVFSYGPSITSQSPLLSGTVGFPYLFALTATGGAQPYTFILTSGTLDAGLTLLPNGVIAGTPLHSETDTLGFQVIDARGARSNVKLFLMTVTGGMTLTGETLPAAIPGVAYSQNISGQVSGGVPPYVFTLISVTGSDSWNVSTAGVITGNAGRPLLVTDVGQFLVTDTGQNLST
jgi:hypothetical protein